MIQRSLDRKLRENRQGSLKFPAQDFKRNTQKHRPQISSEFFFMICIGIIECYTRNRLIPQDIQQRFGNLNKKKKDFYWISQE